MRATLATAALLVAAPAAAQEADRFCPNRPDLGASGCTILPGRVLVELSAIDWERRDAAGEREDLVGAGDVLIRTGLGGSTELQLGWLAYGHSRLRDAAGRVRTAEGVGDVRLGIRRNLRHPDGEGLSFAVEPFVTLPTGDAGVGAGDWGAGVVIPVSYALSERWDLGFTGDATAAVDDDGEGRHLSVNGTFGLGYAITDTVGVVGEVSITRDDDPAAARTEVLAAASIAWRARERLQFDLLAVAGVTRDAPDMRLVLGGAILF